MKFRTDFVTNSSSSSFVIAFNSKEEGINYFTEKKTNTNNDIFDVALRDFNAAEKLSFDDAIERAKEEYDSWAIYYLLCRPYKGCRNFTEYFFKKYGEKKKYHELFEEAEFVEAREKIVTEKVDEFKKKIKDKAYIVEIEYGDHSSTGSQLEHEIMPTLDCTIERFSHH